MKQLMLGNEAVARGAFQAGVKVVAAYPGTPSTEITENVAKYGDIYCEWSPNEKVALEVAIGASIGGARAMCCMKHVGLNVAADPLYTAAYTGVNGGLVVVVADDPGMHSSQNEQDTRNHARAAHIPILEPSDSAEALLFTQLAFEMSEQYDTPVILRLTTRVAHSQSVVETAARTEHEIAEYKKDMSKFVMMPAQARVRRQFVAEREAKLAQDVNTLVVNRAEYRDTAIGIICSGIVYRYVREALPEASVLKLGMVEPAPEKLIREFAAKVSKLYVIEELDPYIENTIKTMGIPCVGKELFPIAGELSVGLIANRILGTPLPQAQITGLPPRPPVLCPGCPHRGVFYVLNKLKLIVSGDIGCYTLGALAPLSAMDACVCMGASIGMAHGMDKAAGLGPKTVAVLGDSTFVHSGITGLVNVVYNKGASTVLILDNSITGMTGHQQNPATGKTIRNEPTTALDLEALVHAVGVQRVRVVDPFDLVNLEQILKEETASDEPSVIIVRRPCALLSKAPVQPIKSDTSKCKKCGMCFKLGCPAIEKQEGVAVINPALCVGCGLCASVCKFGALGE